MPTPVHIGTSGFSYADWKGEFYPEGTKPADRLAYFVTQFKTVEINMTFYRPVSEKILLNWKSVVPKDFAFTMKAGKIITHIRRLCRCKSDLCDMWQQFAPLGKNLACVLFQLPPSLKPDLGLLEDFLDTARSTQSKQGIQCPLAVEFRGRRWYEPQTFKILEEYGATAVLHDMPYKGGFWPIEEHDEMILKSGHLLMLPEDWIADTSAHFFYFRFHGTVNKRAWQEYGAENLEPWARIAGRCLLHQKPFFAYFNNDAHAASVRDAKTFRMLLEREGYLDEHPSDSYIF
jgi:uncharacterized protein YecE (DUF72 family)